MNELAKLTLEAARGNAESQYELGNKYYEKKDFVNAEKW